jgi:amino acid permease
MAEIDKVKEQIGWLKVSFGLLVAIDVSLIAWMAQNMAKVSIYLLSLASGVVTLTTWAIILVSYLAYTKINQLEKL